MTRYDYGLRLLQGNPKLVTMPENDARNIIHSELSETYKTRTRSNRRNLDQVVDKVMKYREQLRKALFIN